MLDPARPEKPKSLWLGAILGVSVQRVERFFSSNRKTLMSRHRSER